MLSKDGVIGRMFRNKSTGMFITVTGLDCDPSEKPEEAGSIIAEIYFPEYDKDSTMSLGQLFFSGNYEEVLIPENFSWLEGLEVYFREGSSHEAPAGVYTVVSVGMESALLRRVEESCSTCTVHLDVLLEDGMFTYRSLIPMDSRYVVGH